MTLSDFTSILQELCHKGYALDNVIVNEEMIKEVKIQVLKNNVVLTFE